MDKQKIVYEVSEESLKNAIRETISSEVEEKIYNKFNGTIVDAKAACQILAISSDTLYKYIKAGAIDCEPRVGRSDLRFRLSHLLQADIQEIRKQLRYSNNYQS